MDIKNRILEFLEEEINEYNYNDYITLEVPFLDNNNDYISLTIFKDEEMDGITISDEGETIEKIINSFSLDKDKKKDKLNQVKQIVTNFDCCISDLKIEKYTENENIVSSIFSFVSCIISLNFRFLEEL